MEQPKTFSEKVVEDVRRRLEAAAQQERDARELAEQKAKEAQHELRESRREWREYALMAAAVLAAAFAGWQGYEARRARISADHAAELARTDAKNAADQARKDSESALQVQADAAKRSEAQADRSAKAAEASAFTALQTLHVSERAYVYMKPSLLKPPSPGEKLQVSVVIGNSGRTPALEMYATFRATIAATSMSAEDVFEMRYTHKLQYQEGSLITLASGQTTEQRSDTRVLPPPEFDQIVQGKSLIYVFAIASYKDIFNQPHHSEICATYHPTVNAFENCHVHNKSD